MKASLLHIHNHKPTQPQLVNCKSDYFPSQVCHGSERLLIGHLPNTYFTVGQTDIRCPLPTFSLLPMFPSTPVRADAKEPIGDETKTSMEEEMKEEEEKEEGGAKQENEGEEEDMGSLEWELRNTESVFSELSELSREYIESVDQGASVRGTAIRQGYTYAPCLQ